MKSNTPRIKKKRKNSHGLNLRVTQANQHYADSLSERQMQGLQSVVFVLPLSFPLWPWILVDGVATGILNHFWRRNDLFVILFTFLEKKELAIFADCAPLIRFNEHQIANESDVRARARPPDKNLISSTPFYQINFLSTKCMIEWRVVSSMDFKHHQMTSWNASISFVKEGI